MSYPDDFAILYEVLLIGSILPVGLFTWFYARRSDWRGTTQGRVLMWQQIVFLVVLTHSFIGVVFDYPLEHWVRALQLIFLLTAMWASFFSLIAAQNRNKARHSGGIAPRKKEK